MKLIKISENKYYGHLSEEEQIEIVQKYPFDIEFIQNPSYEVQLEAVKQDGSAIYYILDKNIKPSEEVQLEAVKKYGLAIKYIPNPSQEVQIEAVKEDGYAIQYITNPSEEVQREAVKQDRLAIYYIKNPSLEVQLAAITGRYGADIIKSIKVYVPNQHPELVKEYAKWVLNEINKN